MSRIFKVGIVGLGRQTIEEHIPALKSLTNITIVALCDINEKNIDETINSLDLKNQILGFKCYKEMFDNTILDFVIVSLPHDQYLDFIKTAAEKRVHILKEKPFARDPEEANKIFALTEQNNIKIMTACQRRFHPFYEEFESKITTLGKIKWIEARYTIPSKNPNSDWRSSKERSGGGVMLDMGYHIFDILMWFFMPFNEVYAITLNHRPQNYSVEDTAFIKFKTTKKDEPDLHIDGSIFISCIYPEKMDELIILGENGSAKLSSKQYTFWDKKQNILINQEFNSKERWLEASKNQILEFIEVIEDEGFVKYFGNPNFQIRNHVPLIKALYESADTHNPVEIKR